ncbi:MAG: cupin domain-containing protein [Thermomicrobiales bacterium]
MPLGGRLDWHTDSSEETQYIIANAGELRRDEGNVPVGPGSIFVLPALVGHNLANGGAGELQGAAYFSGPSSVQVFDEIMRPTNTHELRSPNATE